MLRFISALAYLCYKLLHSAFNYNKLSLPVFHGKNVDSITIAGPCETGYDALKHVIQSISHIMAHRVPFNPTSYHFLPPIVLVVSIPVTLSHTPT